MLYILSSIIILTIVFWLFYRAKVLLVCPICIATVITWALGLLGLYMGASWAHPLLVAILMGASLGASAEKYGRALGLFWKASVVLLGFPAIYYLVEKDIYTGLGLLVVMAIVTIIRLPKQSKKASEQKDLFKDCC